MSATRHVRLFLTQRQTEALSRIAVGHALADEDDTKLWVKIVDACKIAEAEAAEEDADRAERLRPCPRCGRDIVHSKRGLSRGKPMPHRCPHGRECVSDFGCGACKKART